MPNYKTKFNKKWMKLFSWVSEVDDDIHKAYCKVCKCEMKIHVGGVSSLRQHKETAKHKSITSKMVSKSKRDSKGITHEMVDAALYTNFTLFAGEMLYISLNLLDFFRQNKFCF